MKYNEIRLFQGKPDDIVIDEVSVHLENMTNKVWWLGIYRGKKRSTFWIRSKSKIEVELIENELQLKIK